MLWGGEGLFCLAEGLVRPVAVLLWLVGGLSWAAEACSGVEARFCVVEGKTMAGLVGDVFVDNFYAGVRIYRT